MTPNSRVDTAYRVFEVLIVLVTALPTAVHELVHAAVAAPAAERVIVEMDGLGAQTKIRWEDGASTYWVYASALGPSVIGLAVGGIVLAVVSGGGWQLPTSLVDQAAVAGLGAWWLIFTSPLQDLGVFLTQ